MRYFKSKINRKVVAITLLPAILVTLLLSLSSSLLQTSAMEKFLSERGLAIVRQLAPACEYGVYSANQDFLRPIVDSIMKEPNVVSVTVLDAKGHLLINSGDSSFDRPNIGFNSTQPSIIQPTHNINWIFYAPIYQTKLLLEDYSSESIDITKTSKSLVSTDNILGWVSIEISLSEMTSVKRSAWFNTAAIAGTVLLIGTLLALSMGRSITTPISKLMHAVNKVESGDLDFKIDTGASGELKALERAFNKMSKALKETRQEQESKIDKATEELRVVLQELAENNAELESARLKAETASREKSAFLANISHEIRTPLHGAKGFIQLLSETQLQDEQKIYIDRINTSVNTLTTLLNDILDFSRLEVSKLKLEYCDFNPSDMLDDIVRIYAWEANNKGLELIAFSDHNTPLSLHGCSSRIAQILRNLVSNAIKFTQRGEICIRLEKMTSDNHFRFSVTDTGIGISPHERDNLFEPFSQLESNMSRNYAGVGLGLVISKALAELMGGQIYVNSIVGVGTCFSLELPLKTHHGRVDQADADTKQDEVTCWILSPNPSIRQCLQQIFQRWHATILSFGSIAEFQQHLTTLYNSASGVNLAIADRKLNDNELNSFLSLLDEIPEGNRPTAVLLDTSNDHAHPTEYKQVFPHRINRPIIRQEIENLCKSLCHPELPVADQHNRPSQDFKPVKTDQASPRVLLVDDNVINREFLSIWLTKAGFLVSEAINGNMALDACRNNTFQMILMDLHMPGMDGFQAVESIREASSLNAESRIIAVTADATDETIGKINASTFDSYLIKPVSRERLLECLQGGESQHSDYQPPPVQACEAQTPDAVIVDKAHGLRYSSGNNALWLWSLSTLADRLPGYRISLQQAFQQGDREEMRKILHAIKGAASYSGAIGLISSSDRLHAKIKNETDASIETEFTEFLNAITAFIRWVNDLDTS